MNGERCKYDELEKNLASLHGHDEIVLSIFADVRLLVRFLEDGKPVFFDTVSYIYERQLMEADILVVNKIDLLNEGQQASAKRLIGAAYPGKTILFQNSLSQAGIQGWLTACATVDNPALGPSLDIDYAIYGAGEAELGWLDEEIGIVTEDGSAGVAAEIFCTDRVVVLINARVQARPALLQALVYAVIVETEIGAHRKITEYTFSAFQPGYPRPTHRIVSDIG